MNQTNDQVTVIGAGTHIKGEMSFDHTARILGSFEGKITSSGEVQVGDGASCNAAIDARVVMIDGNVDGDITARECVHLSSSAKMTGDVVATKMIVAEGASFMGHCRVGPDAVERAGEAPRRAEVQAAGSARAAAALEHRPAESARTKLAEAQARLAQMATSNDEDRESQEALASDAA